MRSHSPLHPNGGFTLAELIVASAVLALVMGGVYTGFSASVRTWRIGEADLAVYQDARLTLGIVARELQCVLPQTAHLFEGEDDEIQFYALTAPMNLEDGSDPRILRIRYRLKPDPNGRGSVLLREEAPIESPLPPPPVKGQELDTSIIEEGREQSFELVAGVEAFDVEYLWAPSPEPGVSTMSPFSLAQPPVITMTENPIRSGLPQGLNIRLALYEPSAEAGVTSYSTHLVFRGPTTPYDEGESEATSPTLGAGGV
ncbi:MAG: prepilin-type N-terminal cleavage/methylation domain-containing protein [Candidatus Hydrogenedentes bacterium]|nr:prepilin-type N-terminal cleavage/methylation domain-containing protein [Candidatus Hydrogenedentota bacterium]